MDNLFSPKMRLFTESGCHPLNFHDRMGGSYSKKLLELLTVDSGSTRRDEHAYIGHSSGRAKFFELGGFEVGNFEKKNCVFSQLGGARTPFKGLNESTNHKLLFGIQNFPICGTPFPL